MALVAEEIPITTLKSSCIVFMYIYIQQQVQR